MSTWALAWTGLLLVDICVLTLGTAVAVDDDAVGEDFCPGCALVDFGLVASGALVVSEGVGWKVVVMWLMLVGSWVVDGRTVVGVVGITMVTAV